MEDASLGPAPRRPAIVKTGDSADFAPKDAPLRNQPQLPRLAHRLGPPPRAQLLEQPRHMGLHRVGRHVPVGRDLLVRMPRPDLPPHRHLARTDPHVGQRPRLALTPRPPPPPPPPPPPDPPPTP